MDLLKAENLTFTYPLTDSPAVRDASFRIGEDGIWLPRTEMEGMAGG